MFECILMKSDTKYPGLPIPSQFIGCNERVFNSLHVYHLFDNMK